MGFKQKKPPVRVLIDIKEFNLLLSILTINEKANIEDISTKANKLKNKILKYSIPLELEEKTKKIDIRFYAIEVSELILQFLYYNIEQHIDTDYYQTLLELREKYIKENK